MEGYKPSKIDLRRLIEAKSREFQVTGGDLNSDEQFVNSLFAEVFDSDLIAADQRREIEERITQYFEVAADENESKPDDNFVQSDKKRTEIRESMFVIVATASILGATSTGMFEYIRTRTIEPQLLISVFAVLIGSIAALSALVIVRKIRSPSEFPRDDQRQRGHAFESEVAKTLSNSGFDFVIEPSINGRRPDFIVEVDGKKVAVEVKSWERPVPLRLVRRTIDYLRDLVEGSDVHRAVLVVRKKPPIPFGKVEADKISVVSIDDLSKELKRAA